MQMLVKIPLEIPLDLPINYHHIIQGIIYNNLKSKEAYSRFLHDEGFSYGERKFKLFTFSLLQGKYEVADKRIIFRDQVSFKVSSPNNYMIISLADALKEQGIYFKDRHIQNLEIYLFDKTIEYRSVYVRMLSPICLYSTEQENGYTNYCSPENAEEFSKLAASNFIRKYYSYYGIYPQGYIHLEPVQVTKKDKYVTKYLQSTIVGWKGIYRLSGERKYLDFLYQTGLGGKNSQGFGMWDTISEKNIKREENRNDG